MYSGLYSDYFDIINEIRTQMLGLEEVSGYVKAWIHVSEKKIKIRWEWVDFEKTLEMLE